MKNSIKTFLKTSLAVGTLVLGSEAWGSTIELASLDGAGALRTGHPAQGAVAAGTGSILAVPDGAAVDISGTAVTMASGGLVALGKSLTIDIDTDAWTVFEILATQDLDVYVRAAIEGTAVPSFIITRAILGEKAKSVKFWTSDITALTVTGANVATSVNRDTDTLPATDVVSPAPTKYIGGRTYTLQTQFSR